MILAASIMKNLLLMLERLIRGMKDGIVVSPSSYHEESVAEIVKDLEVNRSIALYFKTLHNVFYDNLYFSDHIWKQKFLTTVSTLAFDHLNNGPLVHFYYCSKVINFVATVIDMKWQFRLANPFGATSNVFPPGT